MLEYVQERYKQKEEHTSNTENIEPHSATEDRGATVARALTHHTRRWRERGQSDGSECIHYQVDSQHLRDSERGFRAHECPEQYQQACRNIDCELEEQKALDIAIERASPHHGSAYG